jgi:hypothetical protein
VVPLPARLPQGAPEDYGQPTAWSELQGVQPRTSAALVRGATTEDAMSGWIRDEFEFGWPVRTFFLPDTLPPA